MAIDFNSYANYYNNGASFGNASYNARQSAVKGQESDVSLLNPNYSSTNNSDITFSPEFLELVNGISAENSTTQPQNGSSSSNTELFDRLNNLDAPILKPEYKDSYRANNLDFYC